MALRALALKNTMAWEDARVIEETFRSRLATAEQLSADQGTMAAIGAGTSDPTQMRVAANSPAGVVSGPGSSGKNARRKTRRTRTQPIGATKETEISSPLIDRVQSSDCEAVDRPTIDKSALPLSEPRRYRDRAHLKFEESTDPA
jgi:hypothetical protein